VSDEPTESGYPLTRLWKGFTVVLPDQDIYVTDIPPAFGGNE
jgi:hypothetical protein